MTKDYQKIGRGILDEFLIFMEEKEEFEKLLAQSGADMTSDECKELLYLRNFNAWEILKSKVYEKVRNIGV